MPNLVPIPWQPAYFLTPDTLDYLIAASNRLGTQLQVTDAWRSYAEQAALYKAYREGRGAIASNPDTGQRNHMRGAAFDLVRTDKTAQDACRAVGLLRDPDESWHWNNPRWASMPIIPTNTTTAATAAHILEDDPMAMKYEIIAGRNDKSGTHYISFNRAGRYALSKTSEADYQYWLRSELGYKPEEVAVRVVDSLESFGPILRDAKP